MGRAKKKDAAPEAASEAETAPIEVKAPRVRKPAGLSKGVEAAIAAIARDFGWTGAQHMRAREVAQRDKG